MATEQLITVPVHVDFVKETYNAVCNEWKRKLEKEFPDLFPPVYKLGDKFKMTRNGYDHQCSEDVWMLIRIRNIHGWMMVNTTNGDCMTEGANSTIEAAMREPAGFKFAKVSA
jgi:hypothetical protein